LAVVRRLEADRHGSGPVLDVSGIRAEVRDAGDADVVRWRARMLRARAERPHGPAEAAAHQAVEDARMQAAAVLLELVLPFALHGGALRIEVVEAAEAPAGGADLAGELRQHGGFGHDGGIDPASGDRTATRDAAARLAGAATTVAGRRTDLVIRAGAVAGGGAAGLARGLTGAAVPVGGWRADLVGVRAEAVARGRGGRVARGLTDAAVPVGGWRADLVGVRAETVARGGGGRIARRLTGAAVADAARGAEQADGAEAVASGGGGRVARRLTGAAVGGAPRAAAQAAGAVALWRGL